jgi:hypothetical protein
MSAAMTGRLSRGSGAFRLTRLGRVSPFSSLSFTGSGAAGTTADTSRLAFTTGTATAAIDQGQISITVTVRSVSATGTVQGLFALQHELAATGLHNKASRIHLVTSATFATNAAGLIVGLSCTTAASTVLTFQQVAGEARNL